MENKKAKLKNCILFLYCGVSKEQEIYFIIIYQIFGKKKFITLAHDQQFVCLHQKTFLKRKIIFKIGIFNTTPFWENFSKFCVTKIFTVVIKR